MGKLNFWSQVLMLLLLYAFLYAPIFYVMYVSVQADSVWPFPPNFTLEHYDALFAGTDFRDGFFNSLTIGLGTGAISSLLATMAAMAVLRYRVTGRGLVVGMFLAPLFIAHVLIGISSLMFNKFLLGLPSSIYAAIFANSAYATAFAFLVVLAQLARYDWRLDEASMVFGAGPVKTFFEVTLPLIWPAVFGAFVVGFLLAFNNLEISFYNLGAVPTLPTLAWGSLRHGVSEELYALAALINIGVFTLLLVLYGLLRSGILKLDYRD